MLRINKGLKLATVNLTSFSVFQMALFTKDSNNDQLAANYL
jgi:hypothetical protein